MKTILTVLLISITTAISAQTSVISTKSHSGTTEEITYAPDRYGVIEPRVQIDTLIKISDHCVVQLGEHRYSGRVKDTVCNHWYYEEHNYRKLRIEEYHGKNVVLIGFDEPAGIDASGSPVYRKMRRNSSELLVIILILSGLSAYIFLPKKSLKR